MAAPTEVTANRQKGSGGGASLTISPSPSIGNVIVLKLYTYNTSGTVSSVTINGSGGPAMSQAGTSYDTGGGQHDGVYYYVVDRTITSLSINCTAGSASATDWFLSEWKNVNTSNVIDSVSQWQPGGTRTSYQVATATTLAANRNSVVLSFGRTFGDVATVGSTTLVATGANNSVWTGNSATPANGTTPNDYINTGAGGTANNSWWWSNAPSSTNIAATITWTWSSTNTYYHTFYMVSLNGVNTNPEPQEIYAARKYTNTDNGNVTPQTFTTTINLIPGTGTAGHTLVIFVALSSQQDGVDRLAATANSGDTFTKVYSDTNYGALYCNLTAQATSISVTYTARYSTIGIHEYTGTNTAAVVNKSNTKIVYYGGVAYTSATLSNANITTSANSRILCWAQVYSSVVAPTNFTIQGSNNVWTAQTVPSPPTSTTPATLTWLNGKNTVSYWSVVGGPDTSDNITWRWTNGSDSTANFILISLNPAPTPYIEPIEIVSQRVVNRASLTAGATLTNTLTATATTGNLLVAYIWGNNATTITMGPGTWVSGPSYNTSGSGWLATFYKISSGTEATVTAKTSAVANIAMATSEWQNASAITSSVASGTLSPTTISQGAVSVSPVTYTASSKLIVTHNASATVLLYGCSAGTAGTITATDTTTTPYRLYNATVPDVPVTGSAYGGNPSIYPFTANANSFETLANGGTVSVSVSTVRALEDMLLVNILGAASSGNNTLIESQQGSISAPTASPTSGTTATSTREAFAGAVGNVTGSPTNGVSSFTLIESQKNISGSGAGSGEGGKLSDNIVESFGGNSTASTSLRPSPSTINESFSADTSGNGVVFADVIYLLENFLGSSFADMSSGAEAIYIKELLSGNSSGDATSGGEIDLQEYLSGLVSGSGSSSGSIYINEELSNADTSGLAKLSPEKLVETLRSIAESGGYGTLSPDQITLTEKTFASTEADALVQPAGMLIKLDFNGRAFTKGIPGYVESDYNTPIVKTEAKSAISASDAKTAIVRIKAKKLGVNP